MLAEDVSRRLGFESSDSRATARHRLDVVAVLVSLSTVPEFWLLPDKLRDDILPLTKPASALLAELSASESELATNFEPELCTDVDREMLLRFRLDYASTVKRMVSGQYKRDVRVIRSRLIFNQKLSHEQLLRTVEEAARCRQLREQWLSLQSELKEHLGWRYRDRATDFDACIAATTAFEQLLSTLKPLGLVRDAMLEHGALHDLELSAAGLKQQLERLESCESIILPNSSAAWMRMAGPDSIRVLLPASSQLRSSFEQFERLLEGLMPFCWTPPQNWQSWKAAIEAGKSAIALDETMAGVAGSLEFKFGKRFREWDTDWTEIKAALEWTSRLGKHI